LETPQFIHLSQAGVSLVLSTARGALEVLHWGSALKEDENLPDLLAASIEATAHAELDEPHIEGLFREAARGVISRPALLGHRSGQDFSQLFEITGVESDGISARIKFTDSVAKLDATAIFYFVGHGVLMVSIEVENLGEDFNLEELSIYLPLPDRAQESMDFAGRWIKERQPQRREIQAGTFVREVREGRSSHDYTILQLAMTKGASFQAGEIWSMGLMFSGNSRHVVEQLQGGRKFIGAGESLMPGEIILKKGQKYMTPGAAAMYSDQGIDGLSARSYAWLRSRGDHPNRLKPRPLTLNVWEAVYFDHNLSKLSELADVAQSIGVERFVLDDGWFGSRRDDTKGLGDWVVSKDVWPEGLGPLIQKVKANGMEFGLWFEGEMVNPDSDLYRTHPEWVLGAGGRVPPLGRRQLVLDLSNEACYQHVFGQTDKVLSDYDIAYIKWDHNKYLVEPGSLGQAAAHKQVNAIYRMFTELKQNHPGLEIESCSSGGGRIDLGMAMIADRFWTSDCNDALERQYIQRYTQIAIPPEMLGSHIGPTKSHTTGRVHELHFRAISALFGHAGLEWDITTCTVEELEQLKSWSDYYKLNRELIHSGNPVRVDSPDEYFLQGVVSQDKSKAIFSYATLQAGKGSRPDSLCFPGLEEKRNYWVKAVYPAGEPKFIQRTQVGWLEGIKLSGKALAQVGVRAPIMNPENALLIEIEAI
jgi:alpha-galactosidase